MSEKSDGWKMPCGCIMTSRGLAIRCSIHGGPTERTFTGKEVIQIINEITVPMSKDKGIQKMSVREAIAMTAITLCARFGFTPPTDAAKEREESDRWLDALTVRRIPLPQKEGEVVDLLGMIIEFKSALSDGKPGWRRVGGE